MADKQNLDFAYTTIDRIFRLSMGEFGDFSGAKYDGDFTMTLEEAQRAKHAFVADGLNIKSGSKVLDMSCGWGPFMNYAVKERGANCTGLNLSKGQIKACRKNGLNVFLKDCREVKQEDFGTFDAIASIGGFEHFCSIEEYKAGDQEKIYRSFFETVSELLPVGGRFFLQTMVFSKNMLPLEEFDLHAKKGSPEHALALMEKQFPGSWLPYGLEMVTESASPKFKMISNSSGRLDYIETIGQWRKKYRKFHFKKYLLYVKVILQYLFNGELKYRAQVFNWNPNMICFKDETMDHYRIVFEKV